LHAVRARTPSYPILSLLAQALNAAAEDTSPRTTALNQLSDIIEQYAERIKPAFDKGLFPEMTSTNTKSHPKSKSTAVSEIMVRTMGEEAGLGDVDTGLLVALCCAGDGEDGVGAGERSVKSL
jgi:hypothetical protein